MTQNYLFFNSSFNSSWDWWLCYLSIWEMQAVLEWQTFLDSFRKMDGVMPLQQVWVFVLSNGSSWDSCFTFILNEGEGKVRPNYGFEMSFVMWLLNVQVCHPDLNKRAEWWSSPVHGPSWWILLLEKKMVTGYYCKAGAKWLAAPWIFVIMLYLVTLFGTSTHSA